MQICRVLLELGHSVTVITGAPAGIFIRELRSACLAVRKATLDFGAKQKDAFSVDMAGACPGPRSLLTECLGGAEHFGPLTESCAVRAWRIASASL